MRREDLEAALLLAPKRILVRKETFQLRLGERLVRRRRVLPHDRDAIVPAAVLRAVEPRGLGRDPLDVPQLDFPLQYGEVVLLEEADELVGKAPARLVVILHHERLTRSRRRCPGGRHRRCGEEDREYEPTHPVLPPY